MFYGNVLYRILLKNALQFLLISAHDRNQGHIQGHIFVSRLNCTIVIIILNLQHILLNFNNLSKLLTDKSM